MADSIVNFGEWIAPAGSVSQNVVIFYPPATGDKGPQREEALKLRELGYASLMYQPPYRREDTGGLRDSVGERRLWLKARAEFPLVTAAIRMKLNHAAFKLSVVGKNLGGSTAAFAIDRSVSALIVSGAVPILSAFWARSSHPIAVESREGIPLAEIEDFEWNTREFDLIRTVPALKIPALVQFGRGDEWIEPEAFKEFAGHWPPNVRISWTEDDHAMAGAASVSERQAFLYLRR